MKASDFRDIKVKCLIEHEAEYDFPLFLSLLRKAAGYTRPTCRDDTGISVTRFHYLESGKFRRIWDWECAILAEYYQIPKEILLKKAKAFIKAQAPTPPRKKRIIHHVNHSLPMAQIVDIQQEAKKPAKKS